MKKVGKILTVLLFMFAGFNSLAQNPSDYFIGDWNVTVEGTPDGDVTMVMHIERSEDKLIGEIKDEAGENPIPIDQIVERETSITVYYFASGYDITMDFKKSDDNNISGNLMGMFNAKGTRVIK